MKQKVKIPLFIIAVVLCISLLTSALLSFVYANNQYQITSALAEQLIKEYPNSEQKIIKIIKSNHLGNIENDTLTSSASAQQIFYSLIQLYQLFQ